MTLNYQQLGECVALVKDVITSLSALTAAILAILGLRTWKRQLRGKTEYELARRLLRAIYRARDAIRIVRNPFVSAGESVQAMEEAGVEIEGYDPFNPQHAVASQQAVYQRRWGRLQEAVTELEAEALEAEVVWGQDIRERMTSLHRLVSTLFASIQQYLRNLSRSSAHQAMDQTELERRREIDRIIYAGGEDDQFEGDLMQAVKNMEDYLKRYLKL